MEPHICKHPLGSFNSMRDRYDFCVCVNAVKQFARPSVVFCLL